ncbi:hypothetical protein WA158_003433 [Blastocystis sp. Blastoise]
MLTVKQIMLGLLTELSEQVAEEEEKYLNGDDDFEEQYPFPYSHLDYQEHAMPLFRLALQYHYKFRDGITSDRAQLLIKRYGNNYFPDIVPLQGNSELIESFLNIIYNAKWWQNVLEKLDPKYKVIRDKKLQTIKARDLVIGDIILLQEGDHIPADIRVLLSDGSPQIDMSFITLINNDIKTITMNCLPDPMRSPNLLPCGSYLLQGILFGVVVKTGLNTLYGKTGFRITNPHHSLDLYNCQIEHKKVRCLFQSCCENSILPKNIKTLDKSINVNYIFVSLPPSICTIPSLFIENMRTLQIKICILREREEIAVSHFTLDVSDPDSRDITSDSREKIENDFLEWDRNPNIYLKSVIIDPSQYKDLFNIVHKANRTILYVGGLYMTNIVPIKEADISISYQQ